MALNFNREVKKLQKKAGVDGMPLLKCLNIHV
jgi:hypothetical protein